MQSWINKDWSYHSYRNSDINIYQDALYALAKKGYWCIRMGKAVKTPCTTNHPRIIDYAVSKYRSDFLDMWLMSKCFLTVSTGTGLDEVSRIFRKPIVFVNFIPLLHLASYSHCITVPKCLVWTDTKESLILSEYLDHSFLRTEKYKNAKIEYVDLSPEEIKLAVLEMESRLNGNWQDSEENIQLQDQFWKIFRSHENFQKYHGWINSKSQIGAHFLQKNQVFLN